MKMHHELARVSERPLALAIGFFDGMHSGHREIARATRRLRKPGWRSGVLTFSHHPAAFLRPGTQPPLLATQAERIDDFASAGFEECFFVPFDERIATLAPIEFLDVLVEQLEVRGVAVGSTFRFGHKRAGDVAFMREYLAQRDVALTAVENTADTGVRISSTRIRALVADGDMETADRLLGHAYELRGAIEIGEGRGRTLGFPTANLRVPDKLLPKDGVYAAIARYDGRDYAALLSIGTNPQFGGTERTLEVWLRDFHESIYGRELSVRELRFVREQRVFSSVDALVAQMQVDRAAVAYPSFG